MSAPREPLFGSVDLACRIERMEVDLLTGSAAAASRRDPAAGSTVLALAGGVAVWTGPGQPFNKIAGVGFAGVPRPEELAAAEALYASRGEAVRVELSTLAAPAVGELLTRRGYVLQGFENVLARRITPADREPRPEEIEIAECTPADDAVWTDLVIDGFAHPDEGGASVEESFPREALELTFTDLAGAPGLVRYLARRKRQPAGGASLRLADGVAQLCGAATAPAHRRRGVQSALLAHRLAVAEAAGCKLAVVTTSPGSRSQQNVQRAGFELVYSRAVLELEP